MNITGSTAYAAAAEQQRPLEVTACVCGSTEAPRFTVETRDACTGEAFRYNRCAKCGLDYLNPRPPREAILGYYPPTYHAYQESYGFGQPLRRWLFRLIYNVFYAPVSERPLWVRLCWLPLLLMLFPVRRRPILAFGQPHRKRVFEFGAAAGNDLLTFREFGWEVGGCEPSTQACEVAQRRGLVLQCATAESASLEEDGYSCVLLNNVLEHVYEPIEVLEKCREALEPDGVLVVIVPNHDSWSARILRGYWAGYDGPRHIVGFSPTTIREILSRLRFRIDYIQHRSAFGWIWHTAFLNWLADRRIRGRTRRALAHLLALAVIPLALFATILRRADFIKVVARKV